MSVSLKTIKALFARSNNQCAMPKCVSPIVQGEICLGEICHIKARSAKGPRYDPRLTAEERDNLSNLLLLCGTCHKLVDSDPGTFTPELLSEIKEIHEDGDSEITPSIIQGAELLFNALKPKRTVKAKAENHSVAISVGRDNHGPIAVNVSGRTPPPKGKYPKNSIGSDANMSGYIDYLWGLALEYWEGVAQMTPGRLGKKIKREFRLKTRTRNHIPVEKFHYLVRFLIDEMLAPSPVGKRHARQGTKLCATFEEWRKGR